MKRLKYLLIGLLVISPVVYGAVGKLQNVDFATSAQITGAGGTIAQLLNTSKIYDSTNAQLLDTTIAAKFNTSAFTDAAVTGKLITGYVSGAGVVAATDTILQAIQKLNGNIAAIVPGTGDVVGPASAVNNNVVFFDGITGKLIKDSGLTLSGSNTGDQTITLTGDVTGSGTGSFATTIANLAVTNAKIANSTIDLTAKVTGILPNANTTATDASTASAIVARDASGNFSAGTITAALSGNASTSTALAANPTDCGADSFATAIAANGNLTCTSLAPATSAIGASDIDWSLIKTNSGLYTKTLSANTTITFSNQTAGQTIIVRLTNTASNYTVTWPGSVLWSGGTAPVQTIGAKSDVITLIYDGTNTYGSSVQNF